MIFTPDDLLKLLLALLAGGLIGAESEFRIMILISLGAEIFKDGRVDRWAGDAFAALAMTEAAHT